MATIVENKWVSNGVSTDSSVASSLSAVSWGAVFAGAVVAAATSLIMFILGIGLGLGSVSPWSSEGISASALGMSSILWITFTSLVAAGVGGYLTGRLRTRWLATHTDEVFFRDTAHGFLAWGVATLLTAVIFTSATAGIASMGVKATAAAGGAAAAAGGVATLAATAASNNGNSMASPASNEDAGPLSYYLDSLFRGNVLSEKPVNAVNAQPAVTSPPAGTAATRQPALAAGGEGMAASLAQTFGTQGRQAPAAPMAEVTRIFARAIQKDQLPAEDVTYVGRLVSRQTGLSTEEAEMRVNQTFTNIKAELNQLATAAKQAADKARITSTKISLWFFVALLIGAFTGSYSATIGGRQRDL